MSISTYRQYSGLIMQRAHLLKMIGIVVIAIDLSQLLFAAKMAGQDANATQMRVQLRSKDDDARSWQCRACTVCHTVAAQWECRLSRRYGHFIGIFETQFHDTGIVLSQSL